ncbi:MAG: SRPBCC family protein, partial [Prochlorococcaceae cyanobacterium ETNP1_MAG_9]|nr:SRPBCC family protein [Prochlorococcaceae cyanobacterium ETNP1_MAG_9]
KIGSLTFHLLKGDFRRFEGAWRMHELTDGEGSCLLYELTVQGCLGMPVALIEQRLREDLKTNLLAVEQAALNRLSIG